MSLNELKQLLDQFYPRQFIAEAVKDNRNDEIRLRKRGGPDFSDEDIVGFYNLEDSSLTWDMIVEDVDFFLTQGVS
jgi:hypothetical protein